MSNQKLINKEAVSGDSASFRHFVLLMAGGAGLRAGGDLPKQMQPLNGVPMLLYSIRAFKNAFPETIIMLVLNKSCIDEWHNIARQYGEVSDVLVCYGGANRLESVKNGLDTLQDKFGLRPGDIVAVHDAARPLVTVSLISQGWDSCKENGSAVPVVPEVNSLRYVDNPDALALSDSHFVIRSHYFVVQTPQFFEACKLMEAYNRPLSPEMTDDASVFESAGNHISLYKGDERNIKVTHPDDFVIASALLALRE